MKIFSFILSLFSLVVSIYVYIRVKNQPVFTPPEVRMHYNSPIQKDSIDYTSASDIIVENRSLDEKNKSKYDIGFSCYDYNGAKITLINRIKIVATKDYFIYTWKAKFEILGKTFYGYIGDYSLDKYASKLAS